MRKGIAAGLRTIADNSREGSLAHRFRQRRFAFFNSLLGSLPRPLSILDVGGTPSFWDTMSFPDDREFALTILNSAPALPTTREFTRQVVGDARSMAQFAADEFDVLFSNSVIEHVGDRRDQLAMAREIRRTGRRYFVQTPNRFFPLEPHFLVPGFQFLPLETRVALVRRWKLGHMDRLPDPEQARDAVESVRLLSTSEMRGLFPGASIYEERVLGMTKSLVAYAGWTPTAPRDGA